MGVTKLLDSLDSTSSSSPVLGAAPPKGSGGRGGVSLEGRVQGGRLRRGSSVVRGKACSAPKRSHVMDQVPNVLVGLDPAKRGHPAQPNAVFYYPEQFAIGIPLHFGPGEIRGARGHPPSDVRGRVAVGAVTHRTVYGVPFVAFFDARRYIRRRWRNTLPAAPTNQEALCSCRDRGFETAGLLKRVEFDLRESSDPHDRSQRKSRKHDENPAALHPVTPLPEPVGNAKERADKALGPLRRAYEAALISVTWMVLDALSKVPFTSTFCPANEAGFFWSSSW